MINTVSRILGGIREILAILGKILGILGKFVLKILLNFSINFKEKFKAL